MLRTIQPEPSTSPAWTPRIAVALLFMILASACAVTEADIDAWQTTMRGPGKIVAVLLADKYSDALRVRAGLALVEMDRSDVDGVSELQGALRQLPDDTRARIVDAMAPGLIEMMAGRGRAAAAATAGVSGDSDASLSTIQIRAKDGAFLVLSYASPDKRALLTDAIVSWFVEDFNGRSLMGNFSAEQVIRQIGTPAAMHLVDAMNAQLPQQALTKICELIAQLGDDETKARAGRRIVEIELEMEGDTFGAWLAGKIREQSGNDPANPLSDEAVARGVAYMREQFIVSGALESMHHLAGDSAVAARLLAIAQQPSTTVEQETRRVTALRALGGHATAAQAAPLLALGLDATQPVAVRDAAFDRVADLRDASILPQLWPLATQPAATSELAWRERWRVGALLLTLGGANIASEWIGRLPRGAGEAYAREELFGYAERLSQMRPQPTDLMRARLTSPFWFEQALALYYLEREGTESDLVAIQPLTTSTVATVGANWREHGTIGAIATSTIAAIRERMNAPAPASPAGAADAPAGAAPAGSAQPATP